MNYRELEDALSKQEQKFQELRSQNRALLLESEEREARHGKLLDVLEQRKAQLVEAKVFKQCISSLISSLFQTVVEQEQARKLRSKLATRKTEVNLRQALLAAEKERFVVFILLGCCAVSV